MCVAGKVGTMGPAMGVWSRGAAQDVGGRGGEEGGEGQAHLRAGGYLLKALPSTVAGAGPCMRRGHRSLAAGRLPTVTPL